MSDTAKRLSLHLNLNPAMSDADRFAISSLQHWYRQAKQSSTNQDDLDATVKSFHRNVYLAGLFLHLLDQGLVRQIADALDEGQVSLPTLLHLLNSNGFAVMEKEPDVSFSHQQLTQLHDAVSSSSQHPLLTSISDEIRAITGMLQEQQQQLNRLTLRSGKKNGTESPDAKAQTLHEELLPDVVTHIQQVQKVKQKGIF